MPDEPLFDRESTALGQLLRLVRERAAAEKATADAYHAATADAERDVQRARRTIGAARRKATDDLETSHQSSAAHITGRADGALADANTTRHDARKHTVDHFSGALQKMRADLSDKLWSADSQHEAWDKQAQDEYEDTKRKVSASTKRLEAAWTEAASTLARAGLTREQVEFDPDRLPSPTPTDPVGKVQKCLEDVEAAAERLAAAPLRRLLGVPATFGMFVLVGGLAAAVLLPLADQTTAIALTAGWAVVGGAFLRVFVGVMAKRQVRDRATALGVYAAEAGRAIRILDAHAETTYAEAKRANAEKHAAARKQLERHYHPRIAAAEKQLATNLAKIDAGHADRVQQIRSALDAENAAEAERYEREAAAIAAKYDAELAAAEDRYEAAMAAANAARDRAWEKLSADWLDGLAAVSTTVRELADYGTERFPDWTAVMTDGRPLPADVPPGVRFGSLAVDLFAIPDGGPEDERLVPADPLKADVPAYLPFPAGCSVLVKARDEGRSAAIELLQAVMLRFLTGLPPGKVRFTIIDPVGLGENFATFMHLADYDENLVTSRIWTEPGQIEKRLADLTEHMENVIQKYLRNQYRSIEEYNREAGEVAEPYRVLVIANFPANFSPDAAKRLVSIMSSGPACGVCTLVSVDTRAALPRDFRLADLEAVAFNLSWQNGTFRPAHPDLAAFPLTTDAPPPAEDVAAIVRRVGEASRAAARVEVPFEYIAPPPDRVWTGDAAKSLEVLIGRSGATKRQAFMVGRGTAQHALVAGKTGSGKSTLLHALITNLALTYGPDEAELYLIDFKEGVEFKPYAAYQLPHARVVAIESEREFGLSVLQRLDGILRERGDAFRQAEVNDLAGYRAWLKEQGKPAAVPRILLVVDEFQNFFAEDDKLSQEAALLLDRLVRQGRAFGVHVLLGSQTLGGAYSLARSTIDQMAVRIALQSSEADAQLILSKDNTAARLLNRPGEAIYNDANGRVEGNNPFQVVWLDEDKREQYLAEMRERAHGKYPPPLVFEGNATADLTKNASVGRLLDGAADGPPVVYLGDPVAIKEPTAAAFRPQSGTNLLMLGQHEEAALGLMTSALVSLAARFRPNGDGTSGRVVTVLDGTPDDSEHADHLRNAAHALGLSGAVAERSSLPAALAELAAELDRRQKGESADRTPRFLLIHGLHRLRELRKPEEDFGFGRKGDRQPSPGEHFATLLRDGPPLGIHVVAWCDSLNNLQRALDRQAIREFTLRVLFQMSASDSSHLIDSPAANRLQRNRALYVEEGSERPEKFRPFGLPPGSWLRQVGDRLHEPAAGSA